MAKTILKEEVVSQGPFMMLMHLLTSNAMQVIETKNKGEIAITVRVQPEIAERLDSYAKASRMSRSFLIRMLIEGALGEMDELVITESERREKECEHMYAEIEQMEKEKKEKEKRAKSLLEEWQKK